MSCLRKNKWAIIGEWGFPRLPQPFSSRKIALNNASSTVYAYHHDNRDLQAAARRAFFLGWAPISKQERDFLVKTDITIGEVSIYILHQYDSPHFKIKYTSQAVFWLKQTPSSCDLFIPLSRKLGILQLQS